MQMLWSERPEKTNERKMEGEKRFSNSNLLCPGCDLWMNAQPEPHPAIRRNTAYVCERGDRQTTQTQKQLYIAHGRRPTTNMERKEQSQPTQRINGGLGVDIARRCLVLQKCH